MRRMIRVSAGVVLTASFWLSTGGAVRAQAYSVIHSFSGTDGNGPLAGLLQGTDGNLYGTTLSGGTDDFGTVFKIDTLGNLTTLHSLTGADGDGLGPTAGLVQGTDGNFYGTTSGLQLTFGTVFTIDTSGDLTTLHSFTGPPDGNQPKARLIQATDGNFYGTTFSGGIRREFLCGGGCGIVFRLDSSGTLTKLHDFDRVDGSSPTAGLVQASDGFLYGTTFYGGNTAGVCTFSGCGTIFKVDLSGNFTDLRKFAGPDGSRPNGVIQGSDGNF